MIVYLKNEFHEHILVFDIEFDCMKLVQFAGLLLRKAKDELYIVERSVNVYVRTKVSYPFTAYTGISQAFLDDNGSPIEGVVQIVEDEFLAGIDKSKLLVVSHGLKNDRLVLMENCINLLYDHDKIRTIDGYCTFTNAKKILGRQDNLRLEDVANESIFYQADTHNAFNDA